MLKKGKLFMRPSLCALILFLLNSCQNIKENELLFEQWESPTKCDLYCIDRGEDGSFYIGGGYVWDKGILLSGQKDNFLLDSVTNKAIFDIEFDKNDSLRLIANDNRLYLKSGGRWAGEEVSNQFVLRSFDQSENRTIFVGGKSHAHGFINVFSSNFALLDSHQFDEQINDVVHLKDGHWLAAGYGAVLESKDNGKSWQYRADIDGDFFTDLYFRDTKSIGYIAGKYGSLFTTIDGGSSWSKILSGKPAGGKTKVFNRLVGFDNELWILGDRGDLYFLSGNNDLQKYSLDYDYDLYDGVSNNHGEIVVVGEEGLIGKASLD